MRNSRMFEACWILPIYLLLCAGLASSQTAAGGMVARLPESELEAAEMLSDGVLDSSVWQFVQPYYAQPLNVPYGELHILKELFPELRIPGSVRILKRYDPWGPAEINRFLDDFSEIIPFKPILSFHVSPLKHIGRVGFSFDRQTKIDESRQLAQASLGNAAAPVSFDARIDFTDTHARWRRRNLEIKPVNWLSCKAGNSGFLPDPLVYGRYQGSLQPDSSIRDNWLYGSNRTWNGLVLKADLSKIAHPVPLSLTGFAHLSPGERIGGGLLEFRHQGTFSVFAGISQLEWSDSQAVHDDTLRYIHGGGHLKLGPMVLSLKTAFDMRKGMVPVGFAADFDTTGKSLGISMHYFPAGFVAPASLAWARSAPQQGISAQEHSLHFSVSSRQKFASYVSVSQKLMAFFEGSMASSAAGEIGFSGKVLLDYRICYLYTSTLIGTFDTTNHKISSSLGFSIGNHVRLESTADLNLKSDSYNFVADFASTFAWQNLIITPDIDFRYRTEKTPTFGAGLKQRLMLFDRTYIESAVKRFFYSADEGIRVQGKAIFFL